MTTYEFDGWCLSYEASQLPIGAADVTVPGAFPTFLVPSDVSTLPVVEDLAETGVLATFSKGLASEWAYRMSGPSSGTIDCTRTPSEFGLVEVEGALQKQCILVNRFRYFEPAESNAEFASVRISCSTNDIALACRLRDIYASGWKVSVLLPKDSLSHWREVASASKNFFDGNIQDCGN